MLHAVWLIVKAPKWTEKLQHDRSESRAARVAALYLCRDRLAGIVKTDLAAALGITRWTLDKDLSSLPEVEKLMTTVRTAIEEQITMTTQTTADITITIYENRGDTEDWLTDPDTGEVSEADMAAYDATFTSRMLEHLRPYGVTHVELADNLTPRTIIHGVDPVSEEYRQIEEAVREANEYVSDRMGRDWSWCPGAQAQQ